MRRQRLVKSSGSALPVELFPIMNLNRKLDVLFINPNSSTHVYQDLSKDFSAKETPTWSLLLAQSCRSIGYGVAILDCDAERLTPEAATKRIREIDPRLVCFVVYGQNPSSGTTNMSGTEDLCNYLKTAYPEYPICVVGSHASALPKEVLEIPSVDIVLINEGVYALRNLLKTDLADDLPRVKGIGYKDKAGVITLNPPESVVPQERMDIDLPGYAWDLLPYREKPFDIYRAHLWHADFQDRFKTPFAALYTSLGCRFKCDFCMINIVNRTDHGDDVASSQSNFMRFWSPSFILKEFDKLVNYGVNTIRIVDEMFFLDKRYYQPLLCGLIERGYGDHLRMWTYSRVDTVRKEQLELFRRAGVRWFCLGIEAASQTIRREVTKGTFEEINIRKVVQEARSADINIIANYMFGLPNDTIETMQQTLNLGLEMCTEMWNGYACMALPGSPLYFQAKTQKMKMPESYAGYGFLSYECQPMATQQLSAAEVLRFRDHAFETYFNYPPYLDLVKRKFGPDAVENINRLKSVKLRRRLLGD